ncbi:MAG: 4Fe-4S dicluster domain-containing protein, partial [Propionibacteriaceae bacterium]|nr:4Fe-4S dicluster domain-containing protein [Propionibacteriaceae bacterium]
PNCPEAIAALEIAHQAAILLEFQASEPGQLAEITQAAAQTLAELPLTSPAELISDVTARNSLWSFRKGLYTSVAAGRPQGTTALLEDVVVPVDKLANTCVDLGAAFDQYGYHDAVIFGHAKDGNIHFMITDHFTDSAAKAKLGDFTSDMVEIICGYQGSCKAEHGTGRVMAPFVRRQWGDELYQVMLDVKHLFDPELRLNPGVLIAENPQAHLNQIKAPEAVDDLVDLCVECGYCEPTCPSRELTLTPRQRIAIQRDIAAAAASGDQATVRELERAYVYDGIHTCAVDGWCGLACPVSINTGHYVKKLRSAAVPKPVAAGWTFAANHWKGTTGLAAFALSTVKALPGSLQTAVIGVDHAARAVIGPDTVPLWSRELPQGGKRRARPAPSIPVAAVYLPACVNAMFGSANSSLDGRDGPKPPGVQSAFEWLCALVGIALFVPPDVDMLCCGTVWTSKGILRGKAVMAKKVIKALERATQDWKLPVVCDASSCTEGFQRTVAEAGIEAKIVDAVQFVAERILPLLPEHTKLPSITLHETCSSTQLGSNEALRQVAGAVAEVVQVPIDKGCCAFAGDRGLLHPELTAAATRAEAAEVARLNATVHASCNRTCELGMTRATGKPYRHVLELLAEQLAASTDSAAASANPDK